MVITELVNDIVLLAKKKAEKILLEDPFYYTEYSSNIVYLWNIFIESGDMLPYDERAIDDSHEKFMVHQINNFLERTILENKNNNFIQDIHCNINESHSFRVKITLEKRLRSRAFIERTETQIENTKAKREESYRLKWRYKIFSFIKEQKDWTSLTDIVYNTRRIKSPEYRYELLAGLVDENILEIKRDLKSGKKIKTLYKWIGNNLPEMR